MPRILAILMTLLFFFTGWVFSHKTGSINAQFRSNAKDNENEKIRFWTPEKTMAEKRKEQQGGDQ